MKNLLFALLTVSFAFSAQAKVSASPEARKVELGATVADVIAKTLKSKNSGVTMEAKLALAEIVNDQHNEARTSIINFYCAKDLNSKGQPVYMCEFEIGTDDLNDDDNGWGTIKRITVDGVLKDGEMQVKAANLFNIAG